MKPFPKADLKVNRVIMIHILGLKWIELSNLDPSKNGKCKASLMAIPAMSMTIKSMKMQEDHQ